MMLLTKANRAALPLLDSQEDVPEGDLMIYVAYFHPCSAWSCLAAEFDGDNEFFGFTHSAFDEWGSFFLSDLEGYRDSRFGLPIERDMHFRPRTFREVLATYGKNHGWRYRL